MEEAPQAEKENKVEVVVDSDPLVFDPDFDMEEDPEMYEAAGIPLATSSALQNTVNIQESIQSAIAGLPNLQGGNVTVKVCVITNNHGSVSF